MSVKILLDPLYYTEKKDRHYLGGGSSPDTSGLEEATKQATALQKKIYEETREDVQPWYNLGTGSVSKLSDLLGIEGGSIQSRESIYDELLPQYTSQQDSGSNFLIRPDGTLLDISGGDKNKTYGLPQWVIEEQGRISKDYNNFGGLGHDLMSGYREDEDFLKNYYGYKDFSTSSPTTDYEALNAAVEERLAGQAETPEGFGSLLERFDLDKFEEDPAYQFRQDEANKALERQMASQGVTVGGAGYGEVNPQAYRAMQELNQNLASQEYGDAYNRYNIDQQNIYNRLMGTAGMGQGSTGIMASGGQNYATNVGNLQTGLASAQYQADQASSGGGSMFGTLLGAGVGSLFGSPLIGASIGGSLF